MAIVLMDGASHGMPVLQLAAPDLPGEDETPTVDDPSPLGEPLDHEKGRAA